MIVYDSIKEPFHFRALTTLRELCAKDPDSCQPEFEGKVRQLTIAEDIEARLVNPELWDECLDSCSALELENGYQRFKVVPVSQKLIEIPNGCNLPFLPSDFNAVEGQIFRREDGIYNRRLTEFEFLDHEAWYEVLGRDEALMRRVVRDAYPLLQRLGQETGFAFYLPEMMPGDEKLFSCDQTRPLYLGRISSDRPAHLNCSHFASNACLLQMRATPAVLVGLTLDRTAIDSLFR